MVPSESEGLHRPSLYGTKAIIGQMSGSEEDRGVAWTRSLCIMARRPLVESVAASESKSQATVLCGVAQGPF